MRPLGAARARRMRHAPRAAVQRHRTRVAGHTAQGTATQRPRPAVRPPFVGALAARHACSGLLGAAPADAKPAAEERARVRPPADGSRWACLSAGQQTPGQRDAHALFSRVPSAVCVTRRAQVDVTRLHNDGRGSSAASRRSSARHGGSAAAVSAASARRARWSCGGAAARLPLLLHGCQPACRSGPLPAAAPWQPAAAMCRHSVANGVGQRRWLPQAVPRAGRGVHLVRTHACCSVRACRAHATCAAGRRWCVPLLLRGTTRPRST